VNREEVEPRLWKDMKKAIPLTSTPDWDKIETILKRKYAKLDVRKLVLDNQVAFYGNIRNWKQFTIYKDKQIKAVPSKIGIGMLSDAWNLNTTAWMIFENSNDKTALQRALAWSDMAIKLDADGCKKYAEDPNVEIYDKQPNVQIFDTKANLLYKLGRVNEAIAWEQKAVEQGIINAKQRGESKGDFYDDYMAIIEKMHKREPTWPVKDNK
jgi:tetratricopeptide (TPR) repeat protein